MVWSVLTEWNTGIHTVQGQKVENGDKIVCSPVTGSESLLKGDRMRINLLQKRPTLVQDLKIIRSNFV